MSQVGEVFHEDSSPASTEMPKVFVPRRSRSDGIAFGKALRKRCPRRCHALWETPPDRPDPLRIIAESNVGRLPELIPIRHGRMLASPFTFFRGTASIMAADLASTPTTGLRVQCCGDAHLGNFRCFATPERRIIFDIHDLDETLPAPWEWDVKRLAVSFVLACRENGLSEQLARESALACVRSYRQRMAEFSSMRTLEVWYARFEAEELVAGIEDPNMHKLTLKGLAKAKNVCLVEEVFPKLVDITGDSPKIKDDPPYIYHHLPYEEDAFYRAIADALIAYRASLPDERRVLLDRFRVQDLAIKVVGVGSVGTVCCLTLLLSVDNEPLFLQVKEARPSVLEPFAGKSAYANRGERVVQGHRLMQSASDIFLGWTHSLNGRHYYVRQLRDMKMKFPIEKFKSVEMNYFARWCGATLARAHARSGSPAEIAGYLGKADTFDGAVASTAVDYADRVERDYQRFVEAVRDGKIEVHLDSDG